MREIVLDTETTGLSPLQGHRVVEIGCVELFHHVPTGNVFHTWLNPERDMPEEAARVHGLTSDFLAEKPLFAEKVDGFLAFIGDAPLVIHNAAFDMGFLNAELTRTGFPQMPMERAIDTVLLARKKFPGAPASLDALCKRFGVDISDRTLHGALLDARLLASVYLELRGGRQPGLAIAALQEETHEKDIDTETTSVFRHPRAHGPSPEEIGEHEAFLKKLKNPLWKKAGG